jgi:riboflavin kinase/FMN adenylyltransferase
MKDAMVISGQVIHGDAYGRKLGFPTANLDRRHYARLSAKPKFGIYAGTAQIKNSSKKYKAAILIGPRDLRGLPKIETYLLGFKGNLYGRYVTIQLNKFLRPFRIFSGESALKLQIREDLNQTKKLIKLT